MHAPPPTSSPINSLFSSYQVDSHPIQETLIFPDLPPRFSELRDKNEVLSQEIQECATSRRRNITDSNEKMHSIIPGIFLGNIEA